MPRINRRRSAVHDESNRKDQDDAREKNPDVDRLGGDSAKARDDADNCQHANDELEVHIRGSTHRPSQGGSETIDQRYGLRTPTVYNESDVQKIEGRKNGPGNKMKGNHPRRAGSGEAS